MVRYKPRFSANEFCVFFAFLKTRSCTCKAERTDGVENDTYNTTLKFSFVCLITEMFRATLRGDRKQSEKTVTGQTMPNVIFDVEIKIQIEIKGLNGKSGFRLLTALLRSPKLISLSMQKHSDFSKSNLKDGPILHAPKVEYFLS